jgi:LPXTG-motif cell wall-anchored protein
MGQNLRIRISQLLFAAAIAVIVIGTFVSLGGLSYAASGGGTSPAGDQYGQPSTLGTVTTPSSQTGVAGATAGSGTLPNTGVSLLITLAGGLSLIALGLLVRRGGRRTDQPD